MKTKNYSLPLLLFTAFIVCNTAFAQWKYENAANIKNDIIIKYSVTYENKLTEKQKKSSSYIKEYVLIMNKNIVIEKTFDNSGQCKVFSFLNYNEERFYSCYQSNKSKVAFYKPFKDPSTNAVLQKGSDKEIAGIPCKKYIAFLKGKPVDIYSTKKIGLRYVKRYNIPGFLMEYTLYNKYLGYYKVKAEKILFTRLPQNIYSLENFTIQDEKKYQEKRKEYNAKKKELLSKSIGKKCPKFYSRTIENKKISSKKIIQNKKIMVLNFWFSTCGPCKAEIPKLNQLKETYKDDPNVEFIAIGLDEKSTIKEFLEKHPLSYDIIDEGRWIAKSFGITSYPTNIIVDQNGTIQFFEIGYKRNIKNIMVNKIDELLDL